MDIFNIGKWWQNLRGAFKAETEIEKAEDQELLAAREKKRQEALLLEQRENEWKNAAPKEKALILERRQKEVETLKATKLATVDGWWQNVVNLLKANPGALYTTRDINQALEAQTEEEEEFYCGYEIEYLTGRNVTHLSNGDTSEISLFSIIRAGSEIKIKEIEYNTYFFYPQN